ncbi:MAG: hypothetical protein LBD67_06860, partial [Candidatus Accumulibacter sp.]|nr:hypothetical protein [Accumulibacter sp.]
GVPGLFNPYPLNNFSLLTLRQAFFVKLGTGRMNGLERLSSEIQGDKKLLKNVVLVSILRQAQDERERENRSR